MISAQATQWGRHPVDGHTQQPHWHLGICCLHILTQITIIVYSIQQNIRNLYYRKNNKQRILKSDLIFLDDIINENENIMACESFQKTW